MNRWLKIVVSAFIASIVTANGVRADQTVDVTIDLTVTSQITLTFVGLEMQVSAEAGQPLFLDPTLGLQPYSFLTDTNYVFYGQSYDEQNPPSNPSPPPTSLPPAFWLNYNPDVYPGTEIIGGDSTATLTDVTLAAGTYLLAVVAYDLPDGVTGPVQVLAVNDPNQTFFQDENSTPYSYTYGFDTGTNTGTFTINPAAVVPEPSSATLLAISAGLSGLVWYRRHRTSRAK